MKNRKQGFRVIGDFEDVQMYWVPNAPRRLMKSVTLSICGFFKIQDKSDTTLLKKFYRDLRLSVNAIIKKGFFKKDFIVIQKVRGNFNKTSICFHDSEFTLFFANETDLKELEIVMEEVANIIYESTFNKEKKIIFYKDTKQKKQLLNATK